MLKDMLNVFCFQKEGSEYEPNRAVGLFEAERSIIDNLVLLLIVVGSW